MDLAVAVLWLADPAVGQGVACVVRVHAEVEVVTRVGHGELVGGARGGLGEREREMSVRGAKPCETNKYNYDTSRLNTAPPGHYGP